MARGRSCAATGPSPCRSVKHMAHHAGRRRRAPIRCSGHDSGALPVAIASTCRQSVDVIQAVSWTFDKYGCYASRNDSSRRCAGALCLSACRGSLIAACLPNRASPAARCPRTWQAWTCSGHAPTPRSPHDASALRPCGWTFATLGGPSPSGCQWRVSPEQRIITTVSRPLRAGTCMGLDY